MNLLEEYYESLKATATAEAVRIGLMLDKREEIPDIVQDIMLYCVQNARKYNEARSRPKTFLSLLIKTAGKIYLRRIYRMQTRRSGYIELVELPEDMDIEDESEERRAKRQMIDEYIQTMPEGQAKDFCRQYFIERETLTEIVKGKGIAYDEARAIIFDAMRDLALELGYLEPGRQNTWRANQRTKAADQEGNRRQDEDPPKQRPPP